MSGHNKWSKIKRQKAGTDAQKSKMFSKLGRYIAVEAKKASGNMTSPSLKAAIEKAREANMPNDTIERAIKKATTDASVMENIIYESYGPGGSALIIEALTDNRNKAAQEIKHILSKNGFALAGPGAASWAFTKAQNEWIPNTTVAISEKDSTVLETIINELEENDEVQEVFTNAE